MFHLDVDEHSNVDVQMDRGARQKFGFAGVAAFPANFPMQYVDDALDSYSTFGETKLSVGDDDRNSNVCKSRMHPLDQFINSMLHASNKGTTPVAFKSLQVGVDDVNGDGVCVPGCSRGFFGVSDENAYRKLTARLCRLEVEK